VWDSTPGAYGCNASDPTPAVVPVARPLRRCNFSRGDVVDLDWPWVSFAPRAGAPSPAPRPAAASGGR
jgi:hypothetical protein